MSIVGSILTVTTSWATNRATGWARRITVETMFTIEHFASRSFGVVRPSQPTGDLFYFLHGSRQSGRVVREFSNRNFDAYAARGITVVYPDGVQRHWNDSRREMDLPTRLQGTDDVAFLRELAQHLGARRVWAAGFSNGAEMIIRLLHDAPGWLQAAGIVAATQPAAHNFLSDATNWHPTPVMVVCGQEDPIYPCQGGQLRGDVLSAQATGAYYAQLNGCAAAHEEHNDFGVQRAYAGMAPVEQWELAGVGHVVPCDKPVNSKFLGPARTDWNFAARFAAFAGF